MEQYIVANNKKPGWQKVINQIKKGWPVNEGGFNPYEGSRPGSYSLRSGYETMFTGGKPITQDMVDTYLKGRMAAHNYLNKNNQLAYEPSLLERVKGWFA